MLRSVSVAIRYCIDFANHATGLSWDMAVMYEDSNAKHAGIRRKRNSYCIVLRLLRVNGGMVLWAGQQTMPL